MSDLTLILLTAGNSSRFKIPVKKQWLRIGDDPLWVFVTNRITSMNTFANIIIVGHPDEIPFMQPYTQALLVAGGTTRQESLINALSHVLTPYVLVTDVARACIDDALLGRLLDSKGLADCIVPALEVTDTVVYDSKTIPRELIKRIQTPQLSRTDILKRALETSEEFTDESSAIVAFGGSRIFVEGDERAAKITHTSDLYALECLRPPSLRTFTGNGFDVHPFQEGKIMMLGGVQIDSPVGFRAHSDGDVAIHALIDALLGAACLGDIGALFPDTDASYKNIDSSLLLKRCVDLLHQLGYLITHADLTIIAQTPKIAPYKEQMRRTLAQLMSLSVAHVNIKATTTEHLGFIGRSEGLAVLASASVCYYDWRNG